MPTNCEIIFENNEERVYYGGQTIEGRIRLTLAKGKIVRGNYPLLTTSDFICCFSFFFFPNVENKKKSCRLMKQIYISFLLFIFQLPSHCCCSRMVKPMYRVIYTKKNIMFHSKFICILCIYY